MKESILRRYDISPFSGRRPAALDLDDARLEDLCKQSLQRLEDLKKKQEEDWSDSSPYLTYPGRNRKTESAIGELTPFNPKIGTKELVVEVGIGENDAPTFRELIQSGKTHGYKVVGVEPNPELIPIDLTGDVLRGNVLFPTKAVRDALGDAKVIRMSNTLLANSYFTEGQIHETLLTLEATMQEGAYLLAGHNHAYNSDSEEAFLYQKRDGMLHLDDLLFSFGLKDGHLAIGGHHHHTLFDQELIDALWTKPLHAHKALHAGLKRDYWVEEGRQRNMTDEEAMREATLAIHLSLGEQGQVITRLGDLLRVGMGTVYGLEALAREEKK